MTTLCHADFTEPTSVVDASRAFSAKRAIDGRRNLPDAAKRQIAHRAAMDAHHGKSPARAARDVTPPPAAA